MILEHLTHFYRKTIFKSSKSLTYHCNICGSKCRSQLSEISREVPDCKHCGSTLRMRAMVAGLSEALFGKSLVISDFPFRPDIRGIGMSDWEGYAKPLAQKLNYTNTFYHQPPKLDIVQPPKELEGSLDFILSTDVFEHVQFPIQRAFDNARKLLKSNGVLVFSVPYTIQNTKTIEHFPELHDFEIIKNEDQYILRNKTINGRIQTFENLVFHGGPGSTLEMRVFAEQALLEHLKMAGFRNIQIKNQPVLQHGIHWSIQWALPIVARA